MSKYAVNMGDWVKVKFRDRTLPEEYYPGQVYTVEGEVTEVTDEHFDVVDMGYERILWSDVEEITRRVYQPVPKVNGRDS